MSLANQFIAGDDSVGVVTKPSGPMKVVTKPVMHGHVSGVVSRDEFDALVRRVAALEGRGGQAPRSRQPKTNVRELVEGLPSERREKIEARAKELSRAAYRARKKAG